MEISAGKISERLKDLLINPKQFWAEQRHTGENQHYFLLRFYFPLLLFVAFAVFLGEFFGSNHLYVGFAVLKSVRELVLFTFQYFISVLVTSELIKPFGGEKNLPAVKKLIAYSLAPFMLVSIVTGLFPFLYPIDVLALYGIYIYWMGVKELLVFSHQKCNNFVLVTALINFLMFSILGILLNKLLIQYI